MKYIKEVPVSFTFIFCHDRRPYCGGRVLLLYFCHCVRHRRREETQPVRLRDPSVSSLSPLAVTVNVGTHKPRKDELHWSRLEPPRVTRRLRPQGRYHRSRGSGRDRNEERNGWKERRFTPVGRERDRSRIVRGEGA